MYKLLAIPLLVGLGACVERALPLTNSPITDGGGLADMTMPLPLFDMPVFVDQAVPRDMKNTVDFGGVTCGGATCNSSQECCISAAGSTSCVGKGTCNRDMGAALSCDGPEDCGAIAPACCANIGGMGGSAMCVASCPGMAAPTSGGFSATTKLCHTNSDCAGYSGTVQGFGTLPFTSCCTAPQAPNTFFCAPALITMAGGKCL